MKKILIVLITLQGCTASIAYPHQVTKEEVIQGIAPALNQAFDNLNKAVIELQAKVFPERVKKENKGESK